MKIFALSLPIALLSFGLNAGQSNPHASFPPELAPPGFPQTDIEFAAQVLPIARPGRKLEDVQHDLEANGFICQKNGNDTLICGPRMPSLHNCQRNVTLRTSTQGLSNIQLNFNSPWGHNSDGDICGR